MRRIVVASVISNLEYGGAQRQLVEIANNLDRNAVDHHLISLSRYVPLAENLVDASQLHVIEKGWKLDISVVWRLARVLRGIRADVVHGYLFDAEIAARLAGTMAGTSLVVGSERNADYHLKRRKLVGYALTKPLMDVCIANSAAGAAFNRRMLRHRPDQYCVVPNGVDVERFAPPDSSADLRQALGIPPGDFVVGMVASFKEQKNHEMLFKGVRVAMDRGVPGRIVLVGDRLHGGLGDTEAYHRRMLDWITEYRLADHCLFLGNRQDLPRIYPAFDVAVLTSHFEGTPNVVLEAMACGVPVVVTDVSDNRTLVPNARVGFVVPPNDATEFADRLALLWKDAELRARLGRQARDWVVREYSTTRLAERTKEVYIEQLRQRGKL